MVEREHKWLYNAVQEGDGLELLRDLKSEIVQLVIFDPQYKSINKVTSENSERIKVVYYPTPNQEQKESEIKEFVKEIERVLRLGAFLILWIDDLILIRGNYSNWLPNNLKVIELLIWSKGNYLGLGINYFRKNVEFALLIQKEPYIGGERQRN